MSHFLFDHSHPYLSGNFKPMRFEGEARFLEVEGELPDELIGSLYFNSSCPQFPPTSANYHWFAGDGKVHAYHFKGNGVVDYVTRWVRTQNFALEREAQRALFGNKKYGSRSEVDPSVRTIRAQTANTNAILHANKLFAMEDGIAPIELDPESLETLGSYDFSGSLDGPMTAHVHVDPSTGEMIAFGRQVGGAGSPIMTHQVIDANGTLQCCERFEAPYCALLHDFAITENFVLYPLGPAILDPSRPKYGKPVLGWEPDRSGYIGILPRNQGVTGLQWIEVPAYFMWHTLNAFEVGDEIYLDFVKYASLPRYDLKEDVRTSKDPERFAGRLIRWRISPSTGTIQEEVLDHLISEFPRVDERVIGQQHRHAFFLCMQNKQGESRHWDAVVHLDLQTGRKEIYDPGPKSFVSEGCFAPRVSNNSSIESPFEEADGFYLLPVYHESEKRSDIIVLDARNFSAGPLARIKLPFRMNPTFHCNYYPK